MAEGGFDDYEMNNMGEKYPEYLNMGIDQLKSEYHDLIEQSRESTIDDTETFKKIKYVGDLINHEDEGEGESFFIDDDEGKTVTIKEHDYNKTAWIDSDIDYKQKDGYVITGTRENIQNYINILTNREGNISRRLSEEERYKAIRFLRSFLTVSDGNNSRPLLNNREGFIILKNFSFSRGGAVKFGGLKTILSYKGVDVREINTTKLTAKKLNEDSDEAKEFSKLVDSIFKITNNTITEISNNTKLDPKLVKNIINEDTTTEQKREFERLRNNEIVYTKHTPEIIEAMVREKRKYYKQPKPGEKINQIV